MSNKELKLINSICETKDVAVLLSENLDDLFYAYKDVISAVKSYYSKYRDIPDITVLQEKFSDLDRVEVKGTSAHYLDDLKSDYIRGRIETIITKAADALERDTSPRVLEKLTKELAKLNRFSNAVRDVDVTDWELAENYYVALRAKAEEMGGTPGIPTTIKSIDTVYSTGMAPGHLITAIGWPGKMKSWFAGTLLPVRAWQQGFRPMVVSMEMTPEEVRDRIYPVMQSGFRNSDLARGDISIDDFREWGRKKLSNKPEFIVVSNEGSTVVTPNSIQAKIDQYRPDLVVIDYHQLMSDNNRTENATQRNMNLSRELKMMAMSNSIPIIDITAATSEQVSDREDPPLMGHVAWSKSIEYDANLAFAVHRHDDSGLVEIAGRKNRYGDLFDFFLRWDVDTGQITEEF